MTAQAVLFFVIFYVLAFYAGSLGDLIMYRCRSECSLAFRIAFGGCAVIFSGAAVCLAGGLFRIPAAYGVYLTAALVLASGTVGMVLSRRYGIKTGYFLKKTAVVRYAGICAAALIIILQSYAVTVFRFENIRAVTGIPSATCVYDRGILFPADPVMLFAGSVSSVMNVHPLAFIYGIAPYAFITLYYICYVSVINTVCDTNLKKAVAFAAVTALNVWGYQSDLLIPATLLVSWCGIWVYVIHGLLNIAAVILTVYIRTKPEDAGKLTEYTEDDPFGSEEWDMKNHRIVNARNLAIALGILAAALVAVVFVLNSKINRLYDATVNLQEDLNSRCSVYAFEGNSGEIEGYLLKGKDGTDTFIGGGDRENADALEGFLQQHTSDIDKWYIYGEDEADSGAMKELISSGRADPDNIYVISREEITGLQ